MRVSYRLIPIDATTWSDMRPSSSIRGVLSASVTRTYSSSGAPLLESATLTVSAELGYEFPDGWYRLEALYFDERRAVPLMTMWAYATSDTVIGNRLEISVTGVSVLKPLEERRVLKGDFVAKNSSASGKIRALLEDALPCPVEVSGSFTLNGYYVLDPGTTYLDAVWGLIQKAGWCMQIRPDGTVVVKKKPSDPIMKFDGANLKLFRSKFTRDFDRTDIPNRLLVIDKFGNRYTVENKQPGSKTSYSARGRWIDVVDTDPQPKDGESMLAYARRQMEELSTWARVYNLECNGLIEGPYIFDVVQLTLPNHGLSGDVRITSQSIECGTSLKMTWTAGEEVKEYTA